MGIIKRFVAGCLTAALAISYLPKLAITSYAEEAEDPSAGYTYEEWNGWDMLNVNTKVYDPSMSGDITWYTSGEHTGTEDDPYIIDSVEDYLGFIDLHKQRWEYSTDRSVRAEGHLLTNSSVICLNNDTEHEYTLQTPITLSIKCTTMPKHYDGYWYYGTWYEDPVDGWILDSIVMEVKIGDDVIGSIDFYDKAIKMNPSILTYSGSIVTYETDSIDYNTYGFMPNVKNSYRGRTIEELERQLGNLNVQFRSYDLLTKQINYYGRGGASNEIIDIDLDSIKLINDESGDIISYNPDTCHIVIKYSTNTYPLGNEPISLRNLNAKKDIYSPVYVNDVTYDRNLCCGEVYNDTDMVVIFGDTAKELDTDVTAYYYAEAKSKYKLALYCTIPEVWTYRCSLVNITDPSNPVELASTTQTIKPTGSYTSYTETARMYPSCSISSGVVKFGINYVYVCKPGYSSTKKYYADGGYLKFDLSNLENTTTISSEAYTLTDNTPTTLPSTAIPLYSALKSNMRDNESVYDFICRYEWNYKKSIIEENYQDKYINMPERNAALTGYETNFEGKHIRIDCDLDIRYINERGYMVQLPWPEFSYTFAGTLDFNNHVVRSSCHNSDIGVIKNLVTDDSYIEGGTLYNSVLLSPTAMHDTNQTNYTSHNNANNCDVYNTKLYLDGNDTTYPYIRGTNVKDIDIFLVNSNDPIAAGSTGYVGADVIYASNAENIRVHAESFDGGTILNIGSCLIRATTLDGITIDPMNIVYKNGYDFLIGTDFYNLNIPYLNMNKPSDSDHYPLYLINFSGKIQDSFVNIMTDMVVSYPIYGGDIRDSSIKLQLDHANTRDIDCKNVYNSTIDIISKQPSSYWTNLENSSLNIHIPELDADYTNWSLNYSDIAKFSDINISVDNSNSHYIPKMLAGSRYYKCNINFKLDNTEISNVLINATLYNCNVNVDGGEASANLDGLFYDIFDSTINISNFVQSDGSKNNPNCSITGYNRITRSNITIMNSSVIPSFIRPMSGNLVDSKVIAVLTGDVGGGPTYSHDYSTAVNSEIYLVLDENSYGTVNVVAINSMNNSLLYYDVLSENVYVKKVVLDEGAPNSGGTNTIIIPHMKIIPDADDNSFTIMGNQKQPWGGGSYNIFANLTARDDVDVIYGAGSYMYGQPINNFGLYLNVQREDGSTDVPVYGLVNGTDTHLYNSWMYTNSSSDKIGFLYDHQQSGCTYRHHRFKDCYLYAPSYTPSADGISRSGFITGTSGAATFEGEPALSLFSNVYVNEGFPWFSVNTTAAQFTTEHVQTLTDFPLTEETSYFLRGEEPACFTRFTNDQLTSGELAYNLSNGSSINRRTYDWTYPNVTIEVPGTTSSYTLPRIPVPCTITMPKDNPIKRNPVYKATVIDVERGDVEITGLDGTTTTDGTVYVCANRPIVSNVEPEDEDTILVYATQQLYDYIPTRIPSQESPMSTFDLRTPTGYNLIGYSLNAGDTTIKPVFKTARTITVNLNGSEHGSLTPDTYISAESEKVRFTYTTDPGYTLSNVKINGSPIYNDFFIMPDEDVVITADIVTFTGGITDFKLMGFTGSIDQFSHTIEVKVPRSGNITNALPVITYEGASITPGLTTRCDFSNDVEYTVYLEDGTPITYTVHVIQSDYTMKIYDFSINGVHGDINQISHKIKVTLPSGTNLIDVIPDNIDYSAQSITPSIEVSQDFRLPVTYTLYADGMSPVSYIVEVEASDDSAAYITEFKVADYYGEIDNTNKTITLNVPNSLDLTNVTPSNISYVGKTLTPAKTEQVNMTATQYSVTNQLDEITTYDIVINRISDDTAEITKFVLGGVDGVINETTKTIDVVLSKSVSIENVTPDVLTYKGKSIYPNTTTTFDFTRPVTYTVVAPSNNEVTYTVNVTRLNNEALITKFSLLGFDGVIDQTTKEIVVKLPYGTDLTNLVPSSLDYSTGASITPESNIAEDFTSDVVYTVVSEDGSVTNIYTVKAQTADDYDNKISKFVLKGVEGTIVNSGSSLGTITVNLHGRFDLENAVPDEIIYTAGATLNPLATDPMDFTTVQQYTVTGPLSGERVYTVTVNVEPFDTKAEITSYTVGDIQGTIDQANGTITFTVPASKADELLIGKTPNIVWEGKSISPRVPDGTVTDGEVFTVHAEDPLVTKQYTIKVVKLEGNAIITAMTANGKNATINQEAKTITFEDTTANENSWKNAVPTITWAGKSITPNEGVAVDLTNATYTVTAEDGSTVEYKTSVVLNDNPVITKFVVNGKDGVIDQDSHKITFSVSESEKSNWISVAPTTVIHTGDSLSPNASSKQDFSKTLTYTVSKNSGALTTYTIETKFTTGELSSECEITEFKIGGYSGIISQSDKTIKFTNIPQSLQTTWKNIAPSKVTWTGKSLSPTEEAKQDFTKSVTYKVTAEDDTAKNYTVSVSFKSSGGGPTRPTRPLSRTCEITKYSVGTYNAVIDQLKKTITLTVDENLFNKRSHLVPDVIEYTGASISPSKGEVVNAEKEVTYKVTAEAGNYVEYTLIVLKAPTQPKPPIPTSPTPTQPTPSTDCIITKFSVDGVKATVSQKDLTITITLPLVKYNEYKSAVPKVTWTGERIIPNTGVAVDFTRPLAYTVVAEDETVYKTYSVNVLWANSGEEEVNYPELEVEDEEPPVIPEDPFDEEVPALPPVITPPSSKDPDDDDPDDTENPNTGVSSSLVTAAVGLILSLATSVTLRRRKSK